MRAVKTGRDLEPGGMRANQLIPPLVRASKIFRPAENKAVTFRLESAVDFPILFEHDLARASVTERSRAPTLEAAPQLTARYAVFSEPRR